LSSEKHILELAVRDDSVRKKNRFVAAFGTAAKVKDELKSRAEARYYKNKIK